MNTLLGELATYDDIQYPRYRFAFKLRKLQTSFLLQTLDLTVLQDVLHSTGVQPLSADDELTETQISSIFAEIFSNVKSTLHSQVSQARLQEAHGTCLNWFLMAFQVDGDNKATVGRMKVVLTLFCGGKTTEKAKHLFSILAKNGTVGRDGIQYFCETVQILANCLNEVVYMDLSSIDRAMSESLYHVRDVDDIIDEDGDGGLQRPWLSCLELVKVFTASPSLNFLSWLDLWFSLPQMEKVIHNVKCSICNRKSIIGFRYQCNECSSYHMCQMCFLKGRSLEPHGLEHQVVECKSYSKGLKGIFSKSSQTKDSRKMDESREPPTLRRSSDLTDGSISAIRRLSSVGENPLLSHIRSPSVSSEPTHKATELRIGSRSSLGSGSPKRNSDQLDSMRRLSFCSTNSSDSSDARSFEGAISPMGMGISIGEVGVRKQTQIISSLKRNGPNNVLHESLQKISREHNSNSPIRKTSAPLYNNRHSIGPNFRFTKTTSDDSLQDEFAQLNRKLSYEVDQLLKDMEPEISPVLVHSQNPKKEEDNEDMKILQLVQQEEEEQTLQSCITQAELHKSNLSTNLDSLLSRVQNMHSEFTALKQTGRKSPPTTHHQLHIDSRHSSTSPDLLQQMDNIQHSTTSNLPHPRTSTVC